MSKLKGEVSTSNVPCIEVTWKIPNFSQTSRKVGYKVKSSSFSFAEASWCLVLAPNGIEGFPDVIFISFQRLDSSVSEHSVIARIGFKTDRGEEYRSVRTEGLVDENRNALLHRYPKTSPGDAGDFLFSKETVTVFCQLRLKTQSREALLESPVISDRSLDTSHCNQNIAGNVEATHSASPQLVLLNSITQTDGLRRNSQGSLGSHLSEKHEFELQVSTSNIPCFEVRWKIPNFAQISREVGYAVVSPPFSVAQASWIIRLRPNGIESCPDCIVIALQRSDSSVSDHSVIARMGFKTDRGEEYRSVCTDGLVNEYYGVLFLRYEKRSHVEACDFLLPKGTATVFCHLRLITQLGEALPELPLRPDRSSEISSSNDVSAGNVGATQSASSRTELQNSGTQTDEPHPNSQGIHNMQTDYKKLLESEEEADVRLKVSDKEFRAHKCILRARSSVFSAMFKHDTQEKNSGEVVIEDLDPEAFPDFLQHVYAGSVDTLTEENVFSLYTAADKYNMADLKVECKSYMEKTLSVDTFCDVMILSLRYKEDELLKFAIDFFSKNLTKIIVTVKWQKFLKEYDTAANELLIKALVPANEEKTNP